MQFLRDNAGAIAALLVLAIGIYALFFWDDPAIRRYEEGREKAKEDADGK